MGHTNIPQPSQDDFFSRKVLFEEDLGMGESVCATPENNSEPLIDHPHLSLFGKVPLVLHILC